MRPCTCGQIEKCRLCYLAANDDRYRRLWGIGAGDVIVKPRPEPPASAKDRPALVRCPKCPGNVQIKTHANMDVAAMKRLLDGPVTNMPSGWAEWPVTAEAHRQLLVDAIENAGDPPQCQGRGVVIGAGGAKFFACAWIVVHMLRWLGCRLPVQFWYLGRGEFDTDMQKAAESLGIETVDARQFAKDRNLRPRILNGWELKIFAINHCPFREILWLDADCVPVRDPTYLFETDEFLRCGAIFFPDILPNKTHGDKVYRHEWLPPVCWENCGMEYRRETDFESGQFLVDKVRCWRGLQATRFMNEHSDWYYRFVFGDKSTFHLGFRKAEQEYALVPHAPAGRSYSLGQRDFSGDVVFEHATVGKEKLAGGEHMGHVTHADRRIEAWRALREVWSGDIWSWRGLSDEELAMAKTAPGRYRYVRVGIGEREIELLPGGSIGDGAAACEKRWVLRLIDAAPTLVIVGESHKGSEVGMMLLHCDQDGVWRGDWEFHERSPVELHPLRLLPLGTGTSSGGWMTLISDMHGREPSVRGDSYLVLLGGDICPDLDGSESQYRWMDTKLRAWLDRCPCPVVAVPGNHDRAIFKKKIPPDLRWTLLDSCRVVTVAGRTIFGMPYVLDGGSDGFGASEEQIRIACEGMPSGVDIVLCHQPPSGILDRSDIHGGSRSLRLAIEKMSPKLVVFGHCHQGRGHKKIGDTLYVNATLGAGCDKNGRPVDAPYTPWGLADSSWRQPSRELSLADILQPPPGWQCRPDTYDSDIYNCSVQENEYRLPDAFEPGDVILDVGAHIGSVSLACLVRGAGLVFAIEPIAENFAMLQANVASRFPSRFQSLRCAMLGASDDDRRREAWLSQVPGKNTGGSHLASESDTSAIAVTSISLDRLIALAVPPGRRVRLLKMDCEGAEIEAILGSQSLARVDEIAAEVHAPSLSEWRVLEIAITEKLVADGFDVRWQQTTDTLGLLFATRNQKMRRRRVLLQMATGEQRRLLDITDRHHAAYAMRHGMEFVSLRETPLPNLPASWGKLRAILDLFESGADTVVWLDADTVVADDSADISEACSHGVGMVWYDRPFQHFQAGVLVAHRSEDVISLFRELLVAAEKDSNDKPGHPYGVWEQGPLNDVGVQRKLIRSISSRWNCVQARIECSHPCIVATHGHTMEERVASLTEWSARTANRHTMAEE